MSKKLRAWFSAILLLGVFGCTHSGSNNGRISPSTKKFNAYLDRKFDENVERYPEYMTHLGIKKDYDKLNNYTEAFDQESLEISKNNLRELLRQDPAKLDASGKVSYKLAVKDLQEDIDDFKYRDHNYPVNQMFGMHSRIPSFMINFHKIESEQDAKDYISRIKEVRRVMDELVVNLETRAKKGIVLPKFLFPKIYGDLENLLKGQPFDKSKSNHPLLEDFSAKVEALKIKDEKKEELKSELKQALKNYFQPGYQKLYAYLKTLEKRADQRAGIWKLPDGDKYYQIRLERFTTTKMTPQEIHDLGLSETKRIHEEMKGIMKKVGFKGSLQAFFEKVKTDESLYFANNQDGRKSYLAQSQDIIQNMKTKLPELFGIFPKADLIVKPVEAFREASAGTAFYSRPAPDGSRPGIYYVNLYDLKQVPKYEMEALAYHEAIPGHHMQIAIAQELPALPKFRKYGGYTAYTEGWGLYSEWIPKEIGLYQDPYSDFGRLSMELFRAGRLVVDTGLHYKKWTRNQAIQWLDRNTPSVHAENERAIDRYIVMPGQATAYKIGMIKIQQLREKAARILGENFDVRTFHDEILRHGALPLDILEEQIDAWISRQNLKAAL